MPESLSTQAVSAKAVKDLILEQQLAAYSIYLNFHAPVCRKFAAAAAISAAAVA
jgi:hypothetical protein